MGKNLVIAIYSHPEYYPPTLNAIDQLAPKYDEIIVLHRNITGFDWNYPSNVKLVGPKNLRPVRTVEKYGFLIKIFWFSNFCRLFIGLVMKYKPHTILLYDCIPVLAYRVTRKFIPKPKVLWYHNHDIADENYIRKYSINWFAWKSESWIFPFLNIFSLPSKERMQFFKMEKLRGTFVYLPNFPSVKRYSYSIPKDKSVVKLLFQGSIGPLHGLEQIIPLLRKQYNGKSLRLILKGFISNEYLNELNNLAETHGVGDKLVYLHPSGYREVITNAKTCHIGIGIFMKEDIMNRTLGTASNKIYEYAAAGLPVILFDNKHFRITLGDRNWVFFSDVTETSLEDSINQILFEYKALSNSASSDFKNNFCFELYFKQVIDFIA